MQASIRLVSPDSRMTREDIRQLMLRNEEYSLGKYVGDKNLSMEALLNSTSEITEDRISKGQATARILSEKRTSKAVGIVVVENSPWDTEHFEKSIGRITLALFDSSVGSEARSKLIHALLESGRFQMISARVHLNDLKTVQALERQGAILTDVLLTFRFDLVNLRRPSMFRHIDIGPAHEEEANELVRLGGIIFTVDRFHGDPNIPLSKSDQLYSKWISNSLRGRANVVVLVARREGHVAGFITCKVDKIGHDGKMGVIDLVGVHPAYASQGVGYELVRSALDWFASRVGSVYVGTQAANSRAVRLYEKLRFLHVCSEATLHLWRSSVS